MLSKISRRTIPFWKSDLFAASQQNVITYLKRKYNRRNKLITSDKFTPEGGEGTGCIPGSSVNFSQLCTFIKESFIRNTGFLAQMPHLCD